MYLLLDIETIPRQDIEPLEFDESTVKVGNLKDPVKIHDKITKAQEEYKAGLDKKMSTTPELCQIVSCAMMSVNDNGVYDNNETFYGEFDDNEILREIKNYINPNLVLITWNGKGFDIPVIWKRLLISNSQSKMSFSEYMTLTKKYDTASHIDLMHIWNNFDYGKMTDCAMFFRIDCKVDFDGSMVYDAWKNGEHEKIKKYNMQDVETMYQICKRINIF